MASLIRRVARTAPSQLRTLTTSTVSRKDFVKDLYINELKGYKPAPAAPDAHLAHVKMFAAPSAPKAPSTPSDLASELAAYDAQEPDVAEPGTVKNSIDDGVGGGAAEFLSHLEADIPKEEAHH
ncbi:hypothetical protein FRB96_004773 [Tulasnella sp. 330]|nr:hypothetical protein FRB96_004773 [Tulasnella sp. 330]KAG8872412.1 hypothetical protein FRB97_007688 [Tulasnella sp. 331]KAG8888800.1 hypothetical protein FRB98_006812 [Tulasnella sp. 332]